MSRMEHAKLRILSARASSLPARAASSGIVAILRVAVLSLGCLSVWIFLAAAAAAGAERSPLDELRSWTPSAASQLSQDQLDRLQATTARIESWAAAQPLPADAPDQILTTVRRLLEAQQQASAALEQVFALRGEFAELPGGERRREQLRMYLQTATRLIDLTGRLHTASREAIEMAAYHLDAKPDAFRRLLDQLCDQDAKVGAEVMSYMLFDPPSDSGSPPYSTQEKYRVLNLILATRHHDLLPYIASFIRHEKNPSLVVIAAELIRRLGLPQKPRPGDEAAAGQPPILAEELHELLSAVKTADLPDHLIRFRRDLLAWLQTRMERGIEEDRLRLGSLELRPGDWLLMRNPSPYNLFTDLSPGLFTHVGVVAIEQGEDGIRRFVIVDLPERGARIPATNVETFLTRTLHYVFLRHPDAEVGKLLGQAAVEMIGNESQFDLEFDTSRVEALRGKALRGQLIHTYCAGFLLACTLPTSRPREEFFPITEAVAGGNMASNLQRLGLSFGEDFLSPTGAFFSPTLQIVGHREPVYDPGREVQEGIFDHFARGMIRQTLQPSPDAYQALREKLATMAKDSPWLARALARAADVNARMDLEAAARTAAVIETLDEIAEENVREFAAAYRALLAGPLDAERAAQLPADHVASLRDYQQQHSELARQRAASQLTPRELRAQLVAFYIARGQEQIDARFFAAPPQ